MKSNTRETRVKNNRETDFMICAEAHNEGPSELNFELRDSTSHQHIRRKCQHEAVISFPKCQIKCMERKVTGFIFSYRHECAFKTHGDCTDKKTRCEKQGQHDTVAAPAVLSLS